MNIVFAHVVVTIDERSVLSVFRDGSYAVLDIEQSQGAECRHIAEICGYPGGDRDHNRYARHHDLTHHWLAQWSGIGASPTLWAVARGEVYPDSEREEHHVNCIQRLWADARAGIAWRSREIDAAADALGEHWRAALIAHHNLLDSVV